MNENEPSECPRCGFDEPAGGECPRCGIVFERYRGPGATRPERLRPAPGDEPPRVSEQDRRINRGSWLLLLVIVGALATWAEVRSDDEPDLAVPGAPSADSVGPPDSGGEPTSVSAPARIEREVATPARYPRKTTRYSYVMGHSWHEQAGGFQRAERDAVLSERFITLYVYTDWCPACRSFEENVLSDLEVQDCLAYSVKVKVNPETGPEEREIADRFGVTSYPRLYFYEPETGDWERVATVYGPTSLLSSCQRKSR